MNHSFYEKYLIGQKTESKVFERNKEQIPQLTGLLYKYKTLFQALYLTKIETEQTYISAQLEETSRNILLTYDSLASNFKKFQKQNFRYAGPDEEIISLRRDAFQLEEIIAESIKEARAAAQISVEILTFLQNTGSPDFSEDINRQADLQKKISARLPDFHAHLARQHTLLSINSDLLQRIYEKYRKNYQVHRIKNINRRLLANVFVLFIFSGLAINSIRIIRKSKIHEKNQALAWETQNRVIGKMPISLVLTDTDGIIQYANDMAQELNGYSLDEMLGKKTNIFRSGYHPDSFYKDMWKKIGKGREWKSQILNKKKNGDLYWAQVSINSLHNDSDHITNYLAISQDITDQKKINQDRGRLQEQLKQAQKMEAVGTLAGGVAHDFNNMLMIIQGYTDMVMMKIPRDEGNFKSLEKIQETIERAGDLTRQLLMFSRKNAPDMRSHNLNEIIQKFIKMLHRLIGENIEIITNLESELWPVRGDRGTLEQVIMNLAVNARDAMKTGGKIVIHSSNTILDKYTARKINHARAGKFVCITLHDTGPGIDQRIINRIFEPFFTTKERAEGTGLGLAVVYGIVKQHHGWINVENHPEGGALFSIFLPADEHPDGQTQHQVTENDNLTGRLEKILVIEDEQAILELLVENLRLHNYEPYAASNGREARELFRDYRDDFDLVISDIMLPDDNGIHLTADFIKNRADLKVILSSGYSEAQLELSEARERGLILLSKPYNLNLLLETVRSVLDRDTTIRKS